MISDQVNSFLEVITFSFKYLSYRICHMPQFEKQLNVIEEHYIIFYDKVCN